MLIHTHNYRDNTRLPNRCCLPNVTLIEYKYDERDKPKLSSPNCPPTPCSTGPLFCIIVFYTREPLENVSVLSEQVWPFPWWSEIASGHTFYINFTRCHSRLKQKTHTNKTGVTRLRCLALRGCFATFQVFLHNFHTFTHKLNSLTVHLKNLTQTLLTASFAENC